MSRIGIVGGGAAGLSLGVMLQDTHDVTIFEKSSVPGGLCRSTYRRGYVWDCGPHILGGDPDAVNWVIKSTAIGPDRPDGVRYVQGQTQNYGYVNEQFVKHPFVEEADWKQYQTKMWKHDPDDLDPAGLNAQTGRKPGGVPKFFYPQTGGYQSITDAWAKQLGDKIKYNTTLEDTNDFDVVVSTVPIDNPDLTYNTLITVTLCCWGWADNTTAIYIPEDITPFHRLSFPSNFSKRNAPNGAFIVQGEITTTEADYDTEGLPLRLFELLRQMDGVHFNLDFEGPVELSDVRVIPHAYPVPTKAAMAAMQTGWSNPSVIRHGRTGAYKYVNLDSVVFQSMELAKELNQ